MPLRYRVHGDYRVPVCCVHTDQQATLQYTCCLDTSIPKSLTYHCSSECVRDAWQHHRLMHYAAGIGNLSGVTTSASSSSYDPESSGNSEVWCTVGNSRAYTPQANDMGSLLKFECVPVSVQTGLPFGIATTVTTSVVFPAPSLFLRRMVPINEVHVPWLEKLAGQLMSFETFRVLSYNILADAYANAELYDYCPSWARSWDYRKRNLLREILNYHADIICFQEVQRDHFEEFFAPELGKYGYEALYKTRAQEMWTGDPHKIDGCAIFFRKSRFSRVRKYEIEFNKAAHSLIDSMSSKGQRVDGLGRLVKDNVALIVVLEEKRRVTDNPGERHSVCLTNVHLDSDRDHTDVKLWQVHILLKGLEKIAVNAKIPVLMCVDINSHPNSALYDLLTKGKVDELHPDLPVDMVVDPSHFLNPASKMNHKLPLVSAYSTFRMLGPSQSLEQHRKRMDHRTNEPLFTNRVSSIVDTVDYIFYTADSLSVESLLELMDGNMDGNNWENKPPLPSPEWSSDHIALMAEFRWKRRPNC